MTLVIVALNVARSWHPPNQPHCRQVVVGSILVAVVSSSAGVVVTGTVLVIVAFVVTGSRQPPNQPYRRQVVVVVVRVSVVRGVVAKVAVLSSFTRS